MIGDDLVREIKFRGLCGKHWAGSEQYGKWVHGDLIHATRCTIANNNNMMQYFVDEETVGQYTGLIDENGIEIYEGDIITCDRNINDRFDKTTFEVKFEPTEGFYGESKLGNTVYGEDFNSAKVVGNVHENPELLTKQV